MKFALRKIEKFVKTVAIELHVNSEETGENEVYAPRFLDEIADEIDTLENKKDTLFCEQKRIIYLSRCKVFQNYITFSSSLRSNFFKVYLFIYCICF